MDKDEMLNEQANNERARVAKVIGRHVFNAVKACTRDEDFQNAHPTALTLGVLHGYIAVLTEVIKELDLVYDWDRDAMENAFGADFAMMEVATNMIEIATWRHTSDD